MRTSFSCFVVVVFFFFLGVDGWSSDVSRRDFPPEFVFGAGTSAYQVEGAAAEDGRKPSVWDTFTHQGKTPDKGTGDIASDQYHKYKDDVKLMHKMGLDAYRFSISWSRLIPDGNGAVNPMGLSYYNNLIDELVSYGIQPLVTLCHFDIPQALQDEYEGPTSPKFIEDFTAYADVCFRAYGDRVKSWMTFNEPNIGYGFTTNCSSPPFDEECSSQHREKETYLTGHSILLSHAAAVNLYRTKYQEKQKGQIGITLLATWYEPLTNSALDNAAAKREFDFLVGWFLDPLIYGRYPAIMRKMVGSRLPSINVKDSKQLRGSFDFIGINHYYGVYVQGLDKYGKTPSTNRLRYIRDLSMPKDDFLAPGLGLQKLLNYVKNEYRNPAVVIHENGYMTTADDSSNAAAQNDTGRIQYIQTHIQSLLSPIRNGSDVRGYFVWSFLDLFELFGGYTAHFGLYGVDFNDEDRRRYPRQSAHWYSSFLANRGRNTETSTYFGTA